jgi:hypothetical protein
MKRKKKDKENNFHLIEQNKNVNILVDISTLRLEIRTLIQNIKQSRDWMMPLGLTISFLISTVTSDFKQIFGFPPETIHAVFIILTCISGIYTIYNLIKCFIVLSKTKEDRVVNSFKDKSQLPVEYRVLCIIKSNHIDNNETLLFYKDVIWGCFFLPNVKTKTSIEVGEIINRISRLLNVDTKNMTAEFYDAEYDIASEKYSPFHKCNTLYFTKFCHIKIGDTPNFMKDKIFNVNNIEFKWFTTTEVLSDPEERRLNSDIIRHLEDNNEKFFVESSNSVLFT